MNEFSPSTGNFEHTVWSEVPERREEELSSRPLLVLLHGRGSQERDLFGLVSLLPEHFVVASLRAPIAFSADSFSWFPPAEPGRPDAHAADRVVDTVLDWLDSIPARAGVSLLGFSQGAAMAIHSLRRAPRRFTSVVALAGFVIPGEQQGDTLIESLRPPVFWGRDVADPVIPTDAVDRSSEWLPSHSALIERLYPGIGHSISGQEMADVSSFLIEHHPVAERS